ncbi:MAG: hypothetical protein A4E73_03010 [Syntrophaceae bacterium PtaU1.Bin231]|nr:MAG: hypothetical protein A4E73_03010 [Syntrophaceae bacterium PtaU1.Bin231]
MALEAVFGDLRRGDRPGGNRAERSIEDLPHVDSRIVVSAEVEGPVADAFEVARLAVGRVIEAQYPGPDRPAFPQTDQIAVEGAAFRRAGDGGAVEIPAGTVHEIRFRVVITVVPAHERNGGIGSRKERRGGSTEEPICTAARVEVAGPFVALVVHQGSVRLSAEGQGHALVGPCALSDPGTVAAGFIDAVLRVKPIKRTPDGSHVGGGEIPAAHRSADRPMARFRCVLVPCAAADTGYPVSPIRNFVISEVSIAADFRAPRDGWSCRFSGVVIDFGSVPQLEVVDAEGQAPDFGFRVVGDELGLAVVVFA